jgi:hypothetical protein
MEKSYEVHDEVLLLDRHHNCSSARLCSPIAPAYVVTPLSPSTICCLAGHSAITPNFSGSGGAASLSYQKQSCLVTLNVDLACE